MVSRRGLPRFAQNFGKAVAEQLAAEAIRRFEFAYGWVGEKAWIRLLLAPRDKFLTGIILPD